MKLEIDTSTALILAAVTGGLSAATCMILLQWFADGYARNMGHPSRKNDLTLPCIGATCGATVAVALTGVGLFAAKAISSLSETAIDALNLQHPKT